MMFIVAIFRFLSATITKVTPNPSKNFNGNATTDIIGASMVVGKYS
jgi:hypothetical protein